MKRLISVLMAVVLLLLCPSCTKKGSGKSISYPLSASPSTLDPQFAGELNAQIVINNTFEGLVRYGSDGKIIPGIAEEWSISPDGKTYTFTLKEGTEWFCPTVLKSEFGSDFYKRFSSEKVTAHDFVFAFQRAVLPETKSPNAHRLFVIENASEVYSGIYSENLLGVSAPDDHTLIIKLNEKCDDFLERLTESVFMPCNKDFFNAMNGSGTGIMKAVRQLFAILANSQRNMDGMPEDVTGEEIGKHASLGTLMQIVKVIKAAMVQGMESETADGGPASDKKKNPIEEEHEAKNG